jgi:MATE family multidrug resistance protein
VNAELKAMLRLAWPVILAEIGWIMMGIIDTMIVRDLGPAAIGAVGTGSTIFITLMVLGIGTLFALDTFVSQSFGAGRMDECHRWLYAGLHAAGVLSIGIVALTFVVVAVLPSAGLHPEVEVLLGPYLAALAWSVPPLLAFAVFRRYLQAMNVVKPVMFALISANLVNAGGNWLLIYGHWGFPALGVVGSAYATVGARVYLALFLLGAILWRERRGALSDIEGLRGIPFAVDYERIGRLLRLGMPAALQLALEIGVFAAVAALAARITPFALAANQIVMNVASFFFMIPLGFSAAAAVRVGQAVGRGDPRGVRLAGWCALGLAATYMMTISLLFVTTPGVFLRLFTEDAGLLAASAGVLVIWALFQPFDGCQNVATGALRGLGDTRTPMVVNLVGHWFIGLPLAYWLCFHRGWGVIGLWAGLGVGIALVGVVLIGVWSLRSREFAAL